MIWCFDEAQLSAALRTWVSLDRAFGTEEERVRATQLKAEVEAFLRSPEAKKLRVHEAEPSGEAAP